MSSAVLIHLDDPATGELSFKPVIKGAKWRGGFKGNARKKLAPLDQVMAEIDRVMGFATEQSPRDIEFTERRT